MKTLTHNQNWENPCAKSTGIFSMGNLAPQSAGADRGLAWVRKESLN